MADGSVIIDTLLDTKEFKSEMGKLKGMTNNAMKPVMVSIGAIATAITGVSASAVKFGTEYQKASNQIQASTGATAEEMETLQGAMKNVYANNFGEDMNDVANAVSIARKELGKLDEASLQNVTEYAFSLRDTFEYDISESIRSAKALMDNFGVSGEEAFNLITQGAQNGLDYSGEMLDTISEYSVQFSKLGFSAEDMFNILQKGTESGAFNLDKIGDAVKEFSIRAIDGSNTTIDGFTRLGLNADEMAKKFASGGDIAREAFEEVVTKIGEMDNSVDQSIVGVDLFGTMWEDLGPEVVTQLANMTDEYNQATNSAEKLSQVKYDDLSSAMQGIGRQIQTNLLLPISDKLLPIFNDLANKLSEAFASGNLQSSIDKIASAIGTLVEGVAGVVEKWLPSIIDLVSWIISNAPTIISLLGGIAVGMKVFQIGSSIATFVSGFKSAMTAVQGVSGAFKAFNAVLNSNPIILIISIIAMLVTTLITLWNTNEGFRNALTSIWEGIKNVVSTVVNAIVGFFTETVPNALQSLGNWFAQLPGNIWNWLVQAVTNIYNWGVQIQQKAIEAASGFFNSVIQWFQQLPYNIGLLIGQIIGHIIQFGTNIKNWVTTELPKIIQGIINWFKELPGNIWNWLVKTVTNIAKWGLEMQAKARSAVSGFFNNVINFFKQLPGNIWNWLKKTVINIINWGVNMQTKAKQAMSNMVTSIINTIKNLPSKIVQIGKNIIQGLWNGIQSMIGWIKDKISGFLSGIVDGIKGVLGIHSPSKLMNKEVGRYMAMGIGEGFEDNLDKVYRQMQSAVDFETQKLSANLSTTATNNKVLTANISMNAPDIYMDSTKVARVVTPAVSRTLRGAGAY